MIFKAFVNNYLSWKLQRESCTSMAVRRFWFTLLNLVGFLSSLALISISRRTYIFALHQSWL